MKILQAFEYMSLQHGGGTVDIVYKLSKSLQRKGHEVTIATSDYEVDWNYLEGLNGVHVRMYRNWFNLLGMCMPLNIVNLDIKRYDVIHLHTYRSFINIVLSSKALKYKIPYILDSHGSNAKISKTLFKSFYDITFRRLLHGASKVIAETENGVDEYKSLGIEESKIEVLRSFIDISEFNQVPLYGLFREKYKLRSIPIILFVGRINKIKGLDFLMESFAQLLKTKEAVLVIVGQDDGYKEELEILRHNLGLWDDVIYTGFLNGNEKKSAMVDANMLIQPSISEAGARPSIEALLCGTPVVVTAFTGAGKEIETMDGGYLVGYGDIKGLSNIMQHIIDNKEFAQIKTHHAQRYIRNNFSLEKQVERYEKIYQKSIDSH
jgi:glycosyltransferase involved in cell wall biosynthesis